MDLKNFLHYTKKILFINLLKTVYKKFCTRIIILFLYYKKRKTNNLSNSKNQILIIRQKYFDKRSKQENDDNVINYSLENSEFFRYKIFFLDEDQNSGIVRFTLNLFNILNTEKFDFIILTQYGNNYPISPFFFSFLKKKFNLKIINVWWDSCYKNISIDLKKYSFADCHVIQDNPKKYFIDDKINNCSTIPAVNFGWFKAFKNKESIKYDQREYDFFFIGMAAHYRDYRNIFFNEFLKSEYIKSLKFFVRLWKSREEMLSFPYENFYKIMKNSKIALNFSKSVDCDQLKGRVAEIISNKTLLFESENDQIKNFFIPEKHYIPFNQNNFEEKLRYYLNNPSEAQNIASNAYKHLNQLYDELPNEWQKLINKI